MQVSVENTGSLERRMTVEVPEERISTEVSNRLKSISRTTKVDGFRPGKVPMKLVEKRFGERVRQEVLGEVIRTSFYEAVTGEKLRPAGDPHIEPIEKEEGEGFAYNATFEVYPEVTPAPVDQLTIEKPVCEIVDEDVDKMIENLRTQRRSWSEVERAAQMGDQVTLDFAGKIDDEIFEGGEAKNYPVELGKSTLIEGFEDGLIGATAGSELILDLEFPEQYHSEELAAKPVKFEIKVQKVEEPVLPELDEAFFKEFGVEDAGLEAFRAEVLKNMTRERDNALKNAEKQSVMDALFAANEIEIPRALIAGESARMLEEMKQNMSMQGVDTSQFNDIDPSMFASQATRRVSLGLIIGEIIMKNGIKVEQDKVRAAIQTVAETYDNPESVVKWYYEDRQRLQNVESSILEEEVVSWVMQQASVVDVNRKFDELMNPRQTEQD